MYKMKKVVNFYEVKEILIISEMEIVVSEKVLQEAEMLPGNETFLGLMKCIDHISEHLKYSDDVMVRAACNNTLATIHFHSGFAEIIRLLKWNGNMNSVTWVSKQGKLLPGKFLPRKWKEKEETGLNLFLSCRTDRQYKKYKYFSTSNPNGFYWDRESFPTAVSV